MGKKVRYRGRASSTDSSSLDILIPGMEYEVIAVRYRMGHTRYSLAGFEGKFFDADLFENAAITFVAVSNSAPVIGKPYHIHKLEMENGQIRLVEYTTSSPVLDFFNIEKDLYRVVTFYNIYIVKVG